MLLKYSFCLNTKAGLETVFLSLSCLFSVLVKGPYSIPLLSISWHQSQAICDVLVRYCYDSAQATLMRVLCQFLLAAAKAFEYNLALYFVV